MSSSSGAGGAWRTRPHGGWGLPAAWDPICVGSWEAGTKLGGCWEFECTLDPYSWGHQGGHGPRQRANRRLCATAFALWRAAGCTHRAEGRQWVAVAAEKLGHDIEDGGASATARGRGCDTADHGQLLLRGRHE